MRARVAPRDGGYIEEAASGVFVESCAGEPLEERASRSAGKGTTAPTLRRTGRLSDQHRLRRPRERDDRHDVGRIGTSPTTDELLPVRIEGAGELAGAERLRHPSSYTGLGSPCRASANSNGARSIPRSVMIAVMRSA